MILFLNESELICIQVLLLFVASLMVPTILTLFYLVLIICLHSLHHHHHIAQSTRISLTLFRHHQINGFKHSYVTLKIQFKRTVKEFPVLPINIDNSFQHNLFVSPQLNGSKYCYASLTITLNTSHLFTHS